MGAVCVCVFDPGYIIPERTIRWPSVAPGGVYSPFFCEKRKKNLLVVKQVKKDGGDSSQDNVRTILLLWSLWCLVRKSLGGHNKTIGLVKKVTNRPVVMNEFFMRITIVIALPEEEGHVRTCTFVSYLSLVSLWSEMAIRWPSEAPVLYQFQFFLSLETPMVGALLDNAVRFI